MAIMSTMILSTLVVFLIRLPKVVGVRPPKARVIDGTDMSYHFAYLRNLLSDIFNKVSTNTSSNSIESHSVKESESLRNLESKVENVLTAVNKLSNQILALSEIQQNMIINQKASESRVVNIEKTLEALGKTVAVHAIKTQDVLSELEAESDKNAARARVLQESIVAMAILARQELCCVELQVFKQLRICMECLVTPIELTLKMQDPEFEPRYLDEEAWSKMKKLASNKQPQLEDNTVEEETTNDEASNSENETKIDFESKLATVGVEALLVDEDCLVGCCAGSCSDECRTQATHILFEPVVQAIRSQIPGTLQNRRLDLLNKFEAADSVNAETF